MDFLRVIKVATSSAIVHSREIESKSNWFGINLLITQSFYLNPLHRLFENTKKRPSFSYREVCSLCTKIYWRSIANAVTLLATLPHYLQEQIVNSSVANKVTAFVIESQQIYSIKPRWKHRGNVFFQQQGVPAGHSLQLPRVQYTIKRLKNARLIAKKYDRYMIKKLTTIWFLP